MRNITAIFNKELKSYFNSPIAYIVISIFLLIAGWFFASVLFIRNQASLRYIFNIIPIIFIFFAPALTMRTISEERRAGTIEVLLTMPVQDYEVILGKFFSSLFIILVALLLTLPYYITLAWLGNVDNGAIIGGYLGLFLIGALYISIGILASSLTRNQIVAFLIALFIVVIFFMLDKVLFFFSGMLATLLEYLSSM